VYVSLWKWNTDASSIQPQFDFFVPFDPKRPEIGSTGPAAKREID
jgi:hypothetical protein